MVDPLSTTTGVLSLLSTTVKTSIAVSDFLKSVHEARGQLLEVSHELATLREILNCLEHDAINSRDHSSIPDALTTQLISIIADCKHVLSKIDSMLDQHSGRLGPSQWAITGKKEISNLRKALSTHCRALVLTLESINL